MRPRVTLLLGKPPKPGTLLAEVAENLVAHGCSVTVRLPHDEAVRAADLAGHDLVVHRGLRDSVAPLLGEVHEGGVPLCNPWPGDQLLRDRREWQKVLADEGIPVPPSTPVEQWADVLAHSDGEAVVVKALAGPGRGSQVVAGTSRTLPWVAPFPGPYLVEPHLEADGTDRKLYVAGRSVRGLLKPSTLEGSHVTSGVAFEPGPVLVGLSLRVGEALGLHVVGVDVLDTPAGPVVVDINGFPGFRGVAGAASLVVEHLLAHAAGCGR